VSAGKLPPLPALTLDTAPFYEAAARGELRFQRCVDCRTWRHYPRPACPRCLSRRVAWERTSGHGAVYTWTIVHGPTLPAFADQVPYNVVDVRLDEGIHFVSQVLECPSEALRPDLPVTAVFVPVTTEVTLVKFRRRAIP
jgi:uncharacterized OB-fold protein